MSDKLKSIECVDHLDGAPRFTSRITVNEPGGWPDLWASFARSAARDADSFVLNPEMLAGSRSGISARTSL